MDQLHFDLRGGVCGDMILGAMVDLGVPFEVLAAGIDALDVAGISLRHRKIRKGAREVTKVDVLTRQEHAHRNLDIILTLIAGGRLPAAVKELAAEVFTRLARAEAEVHGTSIEEIHFHEVGALDAIADIVGAAVCVAHLSPRLVTAGPFHFGRGTVRCAHGLLGVPVPAVRALCKGHRAVMTTVEGELVTPTGAAVLVTLLERLGRTEPPSPSLPGHSARRAPDRLGRGAGDRAYPGARGFLEIHAFDGAPDA